MEAFRVEEATIAALHAAVRAGRTTLVEIVQQYLDRIRAFNGPSSLLVTEDGLPVPAARGAVRGGAPIAFPTETLRADTLFPDLDRYRGTPLEWGRMQATASDPSVAQQYGMIVGQPDAGQVNALATVNIRGERSVTCRGDFDRHPDLGPLPAGAPPFCEVFRHYPDALEQAAALDARYGAHPDLAAMPLYGVTFSLKDPFDTKDMRSTGGGDAAYDMDVPARDHILVARLREQGAIILAKAVCTEYNGRAGDPGGRHAPARILPSTLGYQRSSWAGNPCNPYDTRRSASLGSSSGSALSVSVNFVMCSLGEETRASCRGPSNHNAVALILPHKSMIGFDGGAIGADVHCDRTGIHARRLEDCAKVLDALLDPETGGYDPRDIWTTVPRPAVLPTRFASHVKAGSLAGLRIGILRESMRIYPRQKQAEPIVTAAAAEMKAMLRDALGAVLVESRDRLWTPDPELEQMRVDFRDGLCRLVPVLMPDILFRLGPDGGPLFPEFAAAIRPTEFAPGKVFGSGRMAPIDWCLGLAEGRIPPPRDFDICTIQQQQLSTTFRFHISQYLERRAADWQAAGFTETLRDWPALNARSRFWGDDQRAAFRNWEEIADPRNMPAGSRQGIAERIMLRELLRRLDMLVLMENRLDCLVRLHTPLPPALIGHPGEPGTPSNLRPESLYGPNAGLTEVLVPAGYVQVAYDPVFRLSEDGMRYVAAPSDVPTPLAAPGLPFSLVFRGEHLHEDVVLRVAGAYEAASGRRIPPPAFAAPPP